MKTTLAAASKPDEPALVTSLFSRRLAQPLAVAAVRCGVPANAVTVAGGLCWVLSLALPPLLLSEGAMPENRVLAIWLAAAFLWCAGYILDVADGSVARMTGTSCRAGFFLDYVFHLLFKPAFLLSVGLGLCATWGGPHGALPGSDFLRDPSASALAAFWFPLLAVLTVPANGAADTCAAERVLCGEVARGHLKMDGKAAPGLWLGSDEVTAPASRKRGTFLRTAKTLAAEIASYYLQGPFFAALVAADCLLAATTPIRRFPVTTAGFVLLATALVLRIPLRFARESRRLGRATSRGRAGRFCTGASCALRLALALAPAAAAWFEPSLLGGALVAGWIAAALLDLAAAALARRAGSPIHNRYAALAAETAWLPAAAASALVFLAAPAPWAGPALAPLLAVACVAAESGAAAHVFCQDIGKGRLREDSPAAERAALVVRAAFEPAPFATCAKWLFPLALAADAALARTSFHGAATLAFAALAVLSLVPRVRRTMRAMA